MPQSVYTIRTTNGAELKISAASPEEALAAASQWEAQNPSRPTQAPAEPPRQRNGLMAGLGDAWESLTSGAGQLAQNFEGIDRAVFGDLYNSPFFDWERGMADSGERMQDRAVARMTPERRAEREAGNISPQNIFHGLLESAPAMVPSMAAGIGGTLIGGPGTGVGLMAAVEGLQAGGATNDQIIDELMAQGYSEQQAAEAARLPSIGSGALTGAIGRFMPGFETSVLTNPLKMSAMRGLTRGMIDEGVEEGLQSGGEQIFTNMGVGQLDQTRGLFDNVGQAALHGAVLGGVGGGVFGGTLGGVNDLANMAGRSPLVPRGLAERQLFEDQENASLDAYANIERGNAIRSAEAAHPVQTPPASLTYDRVPPQAVPPTPQGIRENVDQVTWRESVADVLNEMAQGNYEALLQEQQQRLLDIEKAAKNKKRRPQPFPDPVPPRPESQLKADPFTPEMGAELIRSAEAGPVTASLLKDKGIPRPSDTLKILERRGFIRQTGVQENTTKLKNGKTRTTKEPVYESTAAKPPEVAGPGEATELYIKPVPVQEPTTEGKPKGPTPQAIKARFDAARARADATRGKLAALPQVSEDWPASRIEKLESSRRALEDQLQQEEFEVARAQTGRAAFAVVEKIAAPVRTGQSPVDGTVMDATADTDGAPRENVVHTFPTRQEAQKWLDAKQGQNQEIPVTPEKKTAGRDVRFERALKAHLKRLGLADDVILKVEKELQGAEGYAETAEVNEQGQSIRMLIALARDVFDPSLTDEQLMERLTGTLHHEAIHALRSLGKFTPQEWNVLARETRSRKKGDREYTYLQWAFDNYKDTYLTEDGKPNMDTIVEEAVAEMFKDWHQSGGKINARYTGLLNKISQFFKELFKQLRADTVLAQVDTGEVGARSRQEDRVAGERMYSAQEEGLPVPPDRRFSFASTKSQRPPRDNYNKFLKMEKAGDSRGTIYLHTGWFRGPDGVPRYEISDHAATLKGAADPQVLRDDIDNIRKTQGVPSPSIYTTLGEVLDHPELFEAYPFLRDVKVEFADELNDGSSFSVGNAALTPTRAGEPPERILVGVARGSGPRYDESDTIKSVILHEVQHAIQGFEGMAGGGNPSRMADLATVSEAVRRRFESIKKELITHSKNQDLDSILKMGGSTRDRYTPSQLKSLEHLMGGLNVMGVPPSNMTTVYNRLTNFAVYESLYGEMEARNTESRINMTPAERLRNAPWRTLDVNENLGISMTLDEKNALLAQVAAKKAAASGVSHYNARNGFTPLETIENLQALAEKNRAAGLNDMADEMLEMASFVDPFGIRPDNIPRISDRRFSYAGARIHSRLGQVINAQTTKKATAQQWLKTLQSQPGVTKDEMDWVGFTDLLSENPDKVMTLEELKEFFEENSIILVDRKRGPGSIEDPVDKEMFDAMVEEAMDDFKIDREQAEKYVTRRETNTLDWDDDEENDDGLVANHSNYSLPGGHTETELLITLPHYANQKVSPYAFRAREHFAEYNVLAHVRFKIREDANGVPTLFIEEIQSDWHQRRKRQAMAGQKTWELSGKIHNSDLELEAFINSVGAMERDPNEPMPARGPMAVANSLAKGLWGSEPRWNTPEVRAEAERLVKERMDLDSEYWEQDNLAASDPLPDAPFKNNAWAKLAIRRIILDAMDNGITQISWTPGHIQAERYHVPGDARRAKANEGLAKFYDDVLTSIVGKEIKPYGGSITTSSFPIPAGREGTAHWTAPARDLQAPTFHITPGMQNAVNGEGFRLYSMARLRPRLDPLDTAMPSPAGPVGGKGAAEMAARYTVLQDYLAKGARLSPIRLAEEDAKDAIDLATTKTQDRMFPVRRMVSEVAKFGGRVTDTNDPVLADTLYTRRAQHKLDKAHANLYRPAYLAIKQIGATEADLKKLAGLSDAARLELESSHVSPSEALLHLFMYARHVPERNKFIEEVRKAKKIDEDTGEVLDEILDAGSGMTNEESAAILAWFDRYAKQSKVLEAVKKVDAIIDYTRSVREASGLSPKWDEIESPLVPRFKHYVPLRGQAMGNVEEDWFSGDETHARTGKAYKVGGREDPSMKGRQSYAGDILLNVLMQNQEAIVRSEKVRVGQALARFVRDNPELTKDYLVELPAIPMQRVVVNGKTRMSPVDVRNSQDYFVTKENGKDVIFEIKNKRLGRSLTRIQSFGDGLFDKIAQALIRPTRLLSKLQTSYNPDFAVTNFLRDVQTAMIQSGQYSPEAWAKISAKALAYAKQGVANHFTGKDVAYQAKIDRLSELGGLTGVMGLSSIETQMQEISKELASIDPQDKNATAKAVRVSMKSMGAALKYMEDLNDAIEGATRLAVFESFKEEGWSEARAAQAAKEMTVNFNAKGEWGPAMNALYMFFNAATQGTANLFKAGIKSPRVQKIMLGIAMAGVLQEIIMSALAPEDEYGNSEYDKIEDYVLEKNMVVMLGDGSYLKIPMPLGYNVFHAMGRNIARVAMGKAGALEAGMSIGSTVTSAFNPFGSNGNWLTAIMPSIVKPLAETAQNVDFTGKPIHPSGTPGLNPPASQEFFPSSSGFAQGVADLVSRATGGDGAWGPGALEMHPDDIDHLVGSYLGGAGRTMGRTINAFGFLLDPQSKAAEGRELAVRDIPIMRGFSGNVSGASVRTSYDQLITPYLRFGRSIKEFEEAGNMDGMASMISRQPERLMIADFAANMERDRIKARREINEIQSNPNIDDASKVAIIKQLRDEEQVLMNLTIQQIRELERQAGI